MLCSRTLSSRPLSSGRNGTNVSFTTPINPYQQERFTGKIRKDDILKCMRNTGTHLESKCGCHHDRHNSFHKSYRVVVGMPKIMNVDGKEVWIGINTQGRKSIDDCLSRSNKYWPLLQMVLSEYERMPNNRRVVSESLLHGQNGGGMLGFYCLKNPFNMDPMSFYQQFLHYTHCSSSNILGEPLQERSAWCRQLKCSQTPSSTFVMRRRKHCLP